jgi:hypothetical protein
LGRKLWLWLFSFLWLQEEIKKGEALYFFYPASWLVHLLSFIYTHQALAQFDKSGRKRKKEASALRSISPLSILAPRYLVTLCPFSHSHARLSIWPVKRIQRAETHETLWPAVDFDLLFLSLHFQTRKMTMLLYI